jgi:hypothetical protein
MTLRFVFYNKILTFASGELSGAGLFRIEMVKARLSGKNFAVLGDF